MSALLELALLKQLEDVIESGKAAFVEVGLALAKIQEDRLYLRGYTSFEEYCQKRWGWNAQRGRQLINAAVVVKGLPTEIGTMVPTERAARELAKVAPEQRPEVIRKAADSGDVTAKSITAAAKPKEVPMEKNGGPKSPAPEPVFDDIGTRIPFHAIPYWKRRQEIQDMLTTLSRIKSTVERAKKEGDCMFGKVSNCAIDNLSQSYTHLLEAKPYAVCTACEGHFEVQPKGCSFCGNKGLISKWQWDVQAPKELKDLRLKANQATK